MMSHTSKVQVHRISRIFSNESSPVIRERDVMRSVLRDVTRHGFPKERRKGLLQVLDYCVNPLAIQFRIAFGKFSKLSHLTLEQFGSLHERSQCRVVDKSSISEQENRVNCL